jgi:hypothetical protein
MQIFGLKINTKDVLVCPARFERATYALEEIRGYWNIYIFQ